MGGKDRIRRELEVGEDGIVTNTLSTILDVARVDEQRAKFFNLTFETLDSSTILDVL